jgi:hypothetical protein
LGAGAVGASIAHAHGNVQQGTQGVGAGVQGKHRPPTLGRGQGQQRPEIGIRDCGSQGNLRSSNDIVADGGIVAVAVIVFVNSQAGGTVDRGRLPVQGGRGCHHNSRGIGGIRRHGRHQKACGVFNPLLGSGRGLLAGHENNAREHHGAGNCEDGDGNQRLQQGQTPGTTSRNQRSRGHLGLTNHSAAEGGMGAVATMVMGNSQSGGTADRDRLLVQGGRGCHHNHRGIGGIRRHGGHQDAGGVFNPLLGGGRNRLAGHGNNAREQQGAGNPEDDEGHQRPQRGQTTVAILGMQGSHGRDILRYSVLWDGGQTQSV